MTRPAGDGSSSSTSTTPCTSSATTCAAGSRPWARWARDELGVDDLGDRAWAAFEAGVRRTIFDEALAGSGVDVTDDLVPRLVEVYRSHAPTIELLTDARDWLDGLAPHVALAVVTDGPLASQQAKAEALLLSRWADLIVFTETLGPGRGKPHPAAFEQLEREVGLDGDRCAYVADNPAKDFVAPHRLGWRTVRVRRAGGLHAEEPSGDGRRRRDRRARRARHGPRLGRRAPRPRIGTGTAADDRRPTRRRAAAHRGPPHDRRLEPAVPAAPSAHRGARPRRRQHRHQRARALRRRPGGRGDPPHPAVVVDPQHEPARRRHGRGRAVRILRRERPDVLHTHNPKPGLYGRVVGPPGSGADRRQHLPRAVLRPRTTRWPSARSCWCSRASRPASPMPSWCRGSRTATASSARTPTRGGAPGCSATGWTSAASDPAS